MIALLEATDNIFSMPRKQRMLVDGGIYHIFNRGNNRRTLFEHSGDFSAFLTLVAEAKAKFACKIHHYCLMSNHFHFLIKIANAQSLPGFMHWLQLGYARYYKREKEYLGHVFQERYRSPWIPKESYYLQCGRYIERNPVKAGMVKAAENYRYSSARYYVNGVADKLITRNLYYDGMGNTEEEKRRAYKKFVEIEEPYSDMITRCLTQA